MEGLSIRRRQSREQWERKEVSQRKGEEKMGGSAGEAMKYGEMVTHSSGGKALMYSLCHFWVIYCG